MSCTDTPKHSHGSDMTYHNRGYLEECDVSELMWFIENSTDLLRRRLIEKGMETFDKKEERSA
jgi:hypothetical protein